jgi:hypothetical protein
MAAVEAAVQKIINSTDPVDLELAKEKSHVC